MTSQDSPSISGHLTAKIADEKPASTPVKTVSTTRWNNVAFKIDMHQHVESAPDVFTTN